MSNIPKQPKPLGIVLIAVYMGFNALLACVMCVPLLFLGYTVTLSMFVGILLMALGVLFGAATYGFWTLEEWGYKLTRGLFIITFMISVLSLVHDIYTRSAGSAMLSVVSISIAIWILYYLSKPETKALFTMTEQDMMSSEEAQ